MSKSKSFPIGDSVRITATIRVSDVLTAPSSVVVTVEEPDGTNNTPAVSNPSTGVYTVCFVPDQAGYHRFRVATSGNNADGVREGTFYVHTSGIV